MRILHHSSKIVTQISRSTSNGVLAGLDVGTKIVGIVVADRSKCLVTPLGRILRKRNRMSEEAIAALSNELDKHTIEHDIAGFVVGVPIYQGKLTPLCEEIIALFSKVEISKPEVFCCFWDESNSDSSSFTVTNRLDHYKAEVIEFAAGLGVNK